MDCIKINAQAVRTSISMDAQPVKKNVNLDISTARTPIQLGITSVRESIKVDTTTIRTAIHLGIELFKIPCNVIKYGINLVRPQFIVNIRLICSDEYVEVLEWASQVLGWDSDEVGTIKYNLLTASDDWTIEEVTIEELL